MCWDLGPPTRKFVEVSHRVDIVQRAFLDPHAWNWFALGESRPRGLLELCHRVV